MEEAQVWKQEKASRINLSTNLDPCSLHEDISCLGFHTYCQGVLTSLVPLVADLETAQVALVALVAQDIQQTVLGSLMVYYWGNQAGLDWDSLDVTHMDPCVPESLGGVALVVGCPDNERHTWDPFVVEQAVV